MLSVNILNVDLPKRTSFEDRSPLKKNRKCNINIKTVVKGGEIPKGLSEKLMFLLAFGILGGKRPGTLPSAGHPKEWWPPKYSLLWINRRWLQLLLIHLSLPPY